MKLEEIRKTCQEIIEKHQVTFSDYHEERLEGKVKFVRLTLKWLVEGENKKKD